MKVVAKEDPPRGFVNLSCVLSAVLPFRTDVHVGLDAGFAKQGCDSAEIPLAATWRLMKFVNTPPLSHLTAWPINQTLRLYITLY